MIFPQEIILDNTKSSFPVIKAKQGKDENKEIKIKIVLNGEQVKPSTKDKAVFRFIKQDSKSGINPARIEIDGSITIILTKEVLACSGETYADILILDGEKSYSSPIFIIHVVPFPFSGKEVESSNEFIYLTETTDKAEKYIKEMEAILPDIRQSIVDTNTVKVETELATEKAISAARKAEDAASGVTDKTLSQPDVAADAKTVGDRLKDIQPINIVEKDGFFYPTNSSLTVNTRTAYTETFIPIDYLKSFKVKRGTNLAYIVYYDIDKNIISNVTGGVADENVTTLENKPENAIYVRFSHWKYDPIEIKLLNFSYYNYENTFKGINKISAMDKNFDTYGFHIKNMFLNNCEIVKGFVNRNGDLQAPEKNLSLIIPIVENSSYTFNRTAVLKAGADYYAFINDKNQKIKNGRLSKEFVTSSVIKPFNKSYDCYTLTAPKGATKFIITIKFNDDSVDSDTFSFCEGSIDEWEEPGLFSSANGFDCCDNIARNKIGTAETKSEKALYPYKDITLSVFGDSLTDPRSSEYVPILKEKLNCKIDNFGISGYTTQGLVTMVSNSEVKRHPSPSPLRVDYSNTDIATIMIGTNRGLTDGSTFADVPQIINHGLADIEAGKSFQYQDRTIATIQDYVSLFPDNYYGNVALSIEWLQWKNPAMRIYLITPPPSTNLELTLDGQSEKVRKAMLEIGRYYGVEVIDVMREAGLSIHNIGIYTKDNVHPNALGGKMIANYLLRKIFNV